MVDDWFKGIYHNGFSQSALLWINCDLSDRRQIAYFSASYSDVEPVKHGVPQGGYLGPLQYAIFSNDL